MVKAPQSCVVWVKLNIRRRIERERERWMCGIRLAAGLLGGAGQKQFTQNMVKISNERNKTNI